ncbi:hypothetical protein Misp03_66100 [Microbispora sp. NBRC 16548]|nr:hypothetical protein Misp03_66100 [Microbispora sp. NBRC 16548]
MKGPVPGPSSTTTGSPRSGTGTHTASDNRRELGATAPVTAGERRNCPKKTAVSFAMRRR